MALFRKRRIMEGFTPLAVRDELELRKTLAAALQSPLEERNALANAAMAWAEDQGRECFERTKVLIMQQESAVGALSLMNAVPGREVAESMAVIWQAIKIVTRARNEEEMLSRLPGTNLPEIVDAATNTLLRDLQRQQVPDVH